MNSFRNWFLALGMRWKLQLGFFVVTMITTIYNRMLASHELTKMTDIAIEGSVPQAIVDRLIANHDAYIFNSIWESGFEFALQFFLIGFVASRMVAPIVKLKAALISMRDGDMTYVVEQTSLDEIGSLQTSFNQVRGTLNEILHEIDGSGKKMGQSAYQIAKI